MNKEKDKGDKDSKTYYARMIPTLPMMNILKRLMMTNKVNKLYIQQSDCALHH